MKKMIRAVMLMLLLALLEHPVRCYAATETYAFIVDSKQQKLIDIPIKDIYNKATKTYTDKYDWDIHNRLGTIKALFPVLVNQLGYTPEQAAGILGNICCEGRVGQYSGQTDYLKNTNEDIIKHLQQPENDAVGLCQWYSKSRRSELANLYIKWLNSDLALVDEHYVAYMAEIEMLYRELEERDLFIKDGSVNYTPEDACGIIAVKFESYDSSSSSWIVSGTKATLVDGGTSKARLRYAEGIYALYEAGGL